MEKLFSWVVVFVFIALIYGAYLIAKTVSYTIFYEDMVEQTVRDMVKSEYLKDV